MSDATNSARHRDTIDNIRHLVRGALEPPKKAAAAVASGNPDPNTLLGLSKKESIDLYYRQSLENDYLIDRVRLARSMISMAQYLPATPTSAAAIEAAVGASATTKLALEVCPKRQDTSSLGIPPKPPKPPIWVDPRPLPPGTDLAPHKARAKEAWPQVLAAAKRLAKDNKRSYQFVQDFLHEPLYYALTSFAFDWSGAEHREETNCYLDVLFPPNCHKCKKKVVVGPEYEANRCNRCRKTWYCCLACTQKDWKEHMKVCPMPSGR